MKMANRMALLKPSGTLLMAEKARERARTGKQVLNLGVGEPDFSTPAHIKEAACNAVKTNFTHYTSSRGILELRNAISDSLPIDNDPNTEIIVTPGSKFGVYAACLATLNPADEVILLSPTWTTHFSCIEFSYAKPVEIPCGAHFSLNEEALKDKISRKSKMVMLCSPNNPTGGVLTNSDLKILSEIAEDHHLLVLSDEVYSQIVYDGLENISIATFENIRDQVIMINGLSKTYAMTGFRIGYIFAQRQIIDAIDKIIQTSTTCPSSFAQKAGVAALQGPQDCVQQMVEEYDQRRRFIVNSMHEIPGVQCPMPKGAFYVFPKFTTSALSSFEFSMKLLDEEGVCTTPGSFFGRDGEHHIRFSFAADIGIIRKAMERLGSFISKNAWS